MNFIRAFLIVALAVLPASAQDFKTVRDGIEYAQFSKSVKPAEKEAAQSAIIYALRIDLKKARLDVVHAMDAAIGVERTSSIAARYNAVAAINAGFFRIKDDIFKGDAVSVLHIDNHAYSESFPGRIALFIINQPNRESIEISHFTDAHYLKIKKREIRLSGLNRQRGADEIIMYTSVFHRTTLTGQNGLELIVKDGKIAQINDGKGNNVIPQNGFVISASGKMRDEILRYAKIGLKVESYTGIPVRMDGNNNASASFTGNLQGSSTAYGLAEDIVGGVPQLIKNGKIEITWEQEKSSKSFVETRHPRTAIAKLKDGRALLVAVDGRSQTSAGMNLQELAEMLLEMGATEAMNLDGGGSTTMFLDGKIINKPSDKEGERPVSDAILVTLRK